MAFNLSVIKPDRGPFNPSSTGVGQFLAQAVVSDYSSTSDVDVGNNLSPHTIILDKR